MLEKFAKWMADNTKLSENSTSKYKSAVRTISKNMLETGITHKALFDMNLFELDIAIGVIFQNEKFIEKNEKGKFMYSIAIKHFRYFLSEVIDDINEVVTDKIITQREQFIKIRIGQSAYRKELIAKYNGQCIVTGIDHKTLLIASHIKPWSVSSDNERIDTENGFLLCANMDKLFDNGLITFNNTGKMEISSFVGLENEHKLHISKGMEVDLKASNKLLQYLEYHRDVLYVR